MTTANNDNAQEETGVVAKPSVMNLVSAMRSSIRGNANPTKTAKDGDEDKEKGKESGAKKSKFKIPGFPWSGKKKAKDDEMEKEVQIETPEEVRRRERRTRRESRKSRTSRESNDSVKSAESEGKEDGDETKVDSDDEAEAKKKKEKKTKFLSKLKNPFKKVKTPEEIEEEERKAKALVYGEDQTAANEIVRKAKEERARQERPWEHPRKAPVEISRVHFVLAMHAPNLISERKVTEKQEDGTKITRVLIDGMKRKKWEKKLVKELVFIAGIPEKHITIDEVFNRDTREGFFHGKKWVIGHEGEFKSAQEKHIEIEKAKQEEKERKRATSFAEQMKQRANKHAGKVNFPSLVSPKNKDRVAAKERNDEEEEERNVSVEAPPAPELKLPDIAKPSSEAVRRKEALAAIQSKKRKAVAKLAKHATQGVGSRWGSNDTANSDAKKMRKANTAQEVMQNQFAELMKDTEKSVEVHREKAVPDYDTNRHSAYSKEAPYGEKDKKKSSPDGEESLMARCLPGPRGKHEGLALLAALKSKGSEYFRCYVTVTFSSCPVVPALKSAVRVTKSATEGVGLPPNGLVSNCVKCVPDPSGERKFFEEWEDYWVNFISPIFFGYSTRKRFRTKTKHKVILGEPEERVENKTRLMTLGEAYDKTCAEYKKRFARGEVSEEYWTPEQLQAHTARERAKFKLDLHIKHVARLEKKKALELSPEPWMRPKVKPKPFTQDQVEKWEEKFRKKEVRKRRKQRENNKELHEKNRRAMLKRVWDRKVQQWFKNKLLSFNANKEELAQRMARITSEEEAAHLKFVQEETDSEKIEAANKELTRKQEKLKEESKDVLAIFRELAGYDKVVKKRVLLTRLGKNRKLKERAKKLQSMKPIVTSPEFINAFMVAPAEFSGHVNREEFSTFCLAVNIVGRLYLRAKQLLKEEKEAEEKKEEEKVNRRENLRKLRAQQAAKRERDITAKKEFEAGKVKGVYFRADQKRVRDETGEVWKKFHHKCIIRLPGASTSYCCESRRRKWEYDMKESMKKESHWRNEWVDFHDIQKETKKKMFAAMVERRIQEGKRRLTKMQKQTVQALLSDVVTKVERRAWVENEVASVLFGVAEKVSKEEGQRLQDLGELFDWHEEEAAHEGGVDAAGMKKRKVPSKKKVEGMYRELHDGGKRDDFETFWDCVSHLENLTVRLLAEFLYKYREIDDEGLQYGVHELEALEDLPDGWRIVSDDQDQVWYDNDITGVSQWERPTKKGRHGGKKEDEEGGEGDEDDEFIFTLAKVPVGGGSVADLAKFNESTTKQFVREERMRGLSMGGGGGGSGGGGGGGGGVPSVPTVGFQLSGPSDGKVHKVRSERKEPKMVVNN